MASSLQIVGVGARTPVGMQSAAAAAAVRAGIVGFGEHPFMVDGVGDLMPGALDVEIDPRIMGPGRLLRLAESALREACAPLDLVRQQPHVDLYLGLPEMRPGFTERDAAAVRAGVLRLKDLPIELSKVSTFTEGHAAGLMAFAAAIQQLEHGACEVFLIGGVESYFHPDTMEWLDATRQLAGARSRSGFIPGEGAGFCLLMTESACVRLGLEPLANVRAVAVGRETKLIRTMDMCFGDGLSTTVREAISKVGTPDQRISGILCDINGERYRSEEWGFACLRLAEYFDDPTAYIAPADCWGDMGAASGPLFAMLACQAFERGYATGPRTLLWASSESGRRSSAVLEAV
jgi:3-oxoacyl-[acyl-carrier-protein] synthase-1